MTYTQAQLNQMSHRELQAIAKKVRKKWEGFDLRTNKLRLIEMIRSEQNIANTLAVYRRRVIEQR